MQTHFGPPDGLIIKKTLTLLLQANLVYYKLIVPQEQLQYTFHLQCGHIMHRERAACPVSTLAFGSQVFQ